MSRKTDLSLSVIVPVHCGGDAFHQCLLSLKAAVPPPSEVIVVADGATDGSDRLAEESGFRVLKTSTRGGPARARNIGARTAQGDVLFFIDADVAIPPGAIGRVIEDFKRHPDVAAIIGSYDDAPVAANFLSQYKNLFHHYVHQTAQEEAFTFWGACGAIRRDAFLAANGFDERYRHPSVEDIELGYRLKRAGYRIRLDRALQIKHLKRWTPFSLVRTDFFHRALPWTDLILRERRLPNDLNLKPSHRVSVVAVYGLAGSGIGCWWWPQAWPVAVCAALTLLMLNAGVYRFFIQKRGLWFAIRALPWHWLYYFYSGLGFGVGLIRYLMNKVNGRRINEA